MLHIVCVTLGAGNSFHPLHIVQHLVCQPLFRQDSLLWLSFTADFLLMIHCGTCCRPISLKAVRSADWFTVEWNSLWAGISDSPTRLHSSGHQYMHRGLFGRACSSPIILPNKSLAKRHFSIQKGRNKPLRLQKDGVLPLSSSPLNKVYWELAIHQPTC